MYNKFPQYLAVRFVKRVLCFQLQHSMPFPLPQHSDEDDECLYEDQLTPREFWKHRPVGLCAENLRMYAS
jgi:hypothetical protein